MRFLLATLWVLLGAALTAGVYWGFLITPESTVWTLMMSAVLAVVALAMAGLTANGTIAILSGGVSAAGMKRALKAIPAVVPAVLIALLMWWIAARVETWVAMRNGQISAWFIARAGWDDVSWLFTTIRYVAQWFRWVITALLMLSLMAGIVGIGWRALAQTAWIRRALHPRAIVVATFAFVVLVALPWMYLVPWRPKNLPASSVEFVFIAAKLSLAALLCGIGAALVVREVSQPAAVSQDPRKSAQAM
jgi:hypothetical protein